MPPLGHIHIDVEIFDIGNPKAMCAYAKGVFRIANDPDGPVIMGHARQVANTKKDWFSEASVYYDVKIQDDDSPDGAEFYCRFTVYEWKCAMERGSVTGSLLNMKFLKRDYVRAVRRGLKQHGEVKKTTWLRNLLD